MTVLFVGSEREALQQNIAAGTYYENNNLLENPYSRGNAGMDGGASTFYECVFSEEVSECWLHYRRRYSGFDDQTSAPEIQFMDAANNIIAKVAITSGSTYVLQYWNGAAFVVVGTSMLNAVNTIWEIDINIKKDATTGRVAWYRSGVLHAEALGLNLTSFGDIAKVRLVGRGSTNYWNQVIATAGDEPTITWNLWTLVPNADGTDTDGIGTYADVDELSMDTNDFIQLDNAGDKHSFLHAAITAEDFIRGVGVAACARRVDGSGPQNIRPYLIIGGVRYYGDTFALTTGFLDYQYIWNLSPATSTDWTTAEVNDPTFEMGWEAVA